MEAGTKVGDGKEVEEFRNYEDSDRHSVRRRIVVDLARQAARFARVSGKLRDFVGLTALHGHSRARASTC